MRKPATFLIYSDVSRILRNQQHGHHWVLGQRRPRCSLSDFGSNREAKIKSLTQLTEQFGVRLTYLHRPGCLLSLIAQVFLLRRGLSNNSIKQDFLLVENMILMKYF